MNKKKKIIIISIILVILVILISVLIFKKITYKEPTVTKPIEVIDNVSDYDYVLEDRDTEIYKKYFNELKDVLKDEIDFKVYSEYVTRLFLIDLYTIDNKISKYDVGGVDFIIPTDQEKYKNKVMDTLYKLVVDNSMNNRKQELPVVKDVVLNNCKTTTYKMDDKEIDAYEISAQIVYEKDLGYDNNVRVIVGILENHAYIMNLVAI